VPNLLDRPADLAQHIVLHRLSFFSQIADHRSRNDVVEQGDGMGVFGEVLTRQLGDFAVL
jgi:hypothetical protein